MKSAEAPETSVKKHWLSSFLFVVLFLFVQPGYGLAAEKVILDTDMVECFDDGTAMIMLARDPRIDLLGVTVVAGNTWVAEGARKARIVLELDQERLWALLETLYRK